MVVKSISYRNDPVILGVPPWKMHIPFPYAIPVMAGEIWNVLEYAGISDVTGVWFGLGLVWPVMCIISVKQRYSGHGKQAAFAAASCRANTVGGMFVIVVDDDIDITNEKDVMWAITQRASLDSIQIIRGIQTKAGAPKIINGKPVFINDRVIIDACWPYERRDKFPVSTGTSSAYSKKIMKKWHSLFSNV